MKKEAFSKIGQPVSIFFYEFTPYNGITQIEEIKI